MKLRPSCCIDGFHAEEGVCRMFSQHRSLSFAPIPASSYGSGIIFIDDFPFVWRGIVVAAQWKERFGAVRLR